ncbi:hypothetical protein EU805_01810 [Salipiger sp. IMCC34102]|uniref:hypothetical protein n=1 Tax=Salipiger sp. IMCC34102 TaxID=2510647 RepID=UPI00101C9D5C|nr:hypothetical protein [Salipiger sp. IMCC34102]RYH04132.1 hypothetical protein EU805_01810 [Salipiger sp. IMCC34102]
MISIEVDKAHLSAAVAMLEEGGAAVDRVAGGTVYLSGPADAAAAEALLVGLAERAGTEELVSSRRSAMAKLSAVSQAIMAPLTDGYSTEEMASWGRKADAARSFDPLNPDPIILHEAASSGEELATLAAVIVAKADAFEALVATVTGTQRRVRKELAAAQDQDAVDAVLSQALVEMAALAEQAASAS